MVKKIVFNFIQTTLRRMILTQSVTSSSDTVCVDNTLKACLYCRCVWCVMAAGCVCSRLKVAKLAWVSAQIHCQCSVSENRVVLPVDSTQINTSEIAVSSSDTTFVPFKGVLLMLLISRRLLIAGCL